MYFSYFVFLVNSFIAFCHTTNFVHIQIYCFVCALITHTCVVCRSKWVHANKSNYNYTTFFLYTSIVYSNIPLCVYMFVAYRHFSCHCGSALAYILAFIKCDVAQISLDTSTNELAFICGSTSHIDRCYWVGYVFSAIFWYFLITNVF